MFLFKLARSIKSHQISEAIYVYTLNMLNLKKNNLAFFTEVRIKACNENALIKLGFTSTNDKSAAQLYEYYLGYRKR